MLSREAKHLAIGEEKTICSMARFFASLRFAQNDKLPYSLINERVTITNAIESVSLSKYFGIFPRFVGETLSGKKAFIALGLTAELGGLRFCWKRIK